MISRRPSLALICGALFFSQISFAKPTPPTNVDQFLRDFEKGERPSAEKFPVGTALISQMTNPRNGQVRTTWLAILNARLKDRKETVWYSSDIFFSQDPVKFYSWNDINGGSYYPTSLTKDFVTSPRKSEIGGRAVQEISSFRTLSDADGTLILEKRSCFLKEGCKVWGVCSEPYTKPCGLFKQCTAWRERACELKAAQGELTYFAVYDYANVKHYTPPVDLPPPAFVQK